MANKTGFIISGRDASKRQLVIAAGWQDATFLLPGRTVIEKPEIQLVCDVPLGSPGYKETLAAFGSKNPNDGYMIVARILAMAAKGIPIIGANGRLM